MSYLALKLRNAPVKVHHALLQILTEAADVQVIGRRIVHFPLAQQTRQLQPGLSERRA